ncbi:type IV pilus secretin PilQ [Thermodesulfobacteriota bacterium]
MLYSKGNFYIWRRLSWLVIGLFLVMFSFGCAGKTANKDPFFEKWKVVAEESKGYSPSPKARTIDLPERRKEDLRELTAEPAPEKRLPTSKVSLTMHDAAVPVLLRALAKAANQNIMVNSVVTGKININVESAPWDQVFLGILKTQGLTYTWEGDIIRIISTADMEQSLKIDSIREKHEASKIGIRRAEPLLTRIVNIDYADAEKVKENLLGFLTKDKEGKPRGGITVDQHTNSLIIQAIRDDLARMIPIIEELDRPTPQVLIEADIVEATRDTARQLGIRWGGLYHGTSSNKNLWITPGANTGNAMGNSINTGIDPTTGMAADFASDFVAAGGSGFTLGFMAERVGRSLLNIELSALQSEGKLNILSSPSIITLDNQTAFTENGEKVPYISTDAEGNRQVKFEEVVLRLEIKPHVIEGKLLRMDITVIKDDVDPTRSVDGNPYIIKKKTKTTLIVEDSETIVISGLSRQRKFGSEDGIPGIKDVPLFGYLFKSDNKDSSMEEVLIFITPRVLKTREAVKEKQ